MRRALLAVLAILALLCTGIVAVQALATQTASCTPTPPITQTNKQVKAVVVCAFPSAPSVTKTFASTVKPSPTPTPSPSATVTPTPTPTVTATASPTPTPTSTPTSGPTGFPDASNTGVPAGTVLTAYTGPCLISAAGTVIDSKTINCDGVLVRAANVTIRNSKVNSRIIVDTDISQSWSLTLIDSEVDAGAGDLPAIYNGNVTIIRANIHGGHNGLECQEHSSRCSMRDSWVHDQWQAATGDTHLGGFLALGSVVPCVGPDANGVPACVDLVHNSITCDAPVNTSGGGCTGDINLINHFGPLHGALIQGNYLGANTGSAYCTYGSAGFEHPADHIVYRDNVFARGTNGKCAAFGPVTNFDPAAPGNVWTGNVWDDGTPVAAAN